MLEFNLVNLKNKQKQKMPDLQRDHERRIELQKKLNPIDYLVKISHSPEYIEEVQRIRQSDEFHDLTNQEKGTLAITNTADRLSKTLESSGGHMPIEGQLLALISHIPPYLMAQIKLDRMRNKGHSVRRSEKMPYLQEVMQTNRTLKELIDNNPLLTYPQVLNFTSFVSAKLSGPEYTEYFTQSMEAMLSGMRHEIAVEQMLGTLDPEVDYRETTPEEDLAGADFIIQMATADGKPYEFGIDVKSTPFEEERSREKARSHGYPSDHIIWSGINREDFNNGFRISRVLAEERGLALYDKLLAAGADQYRRAEAS